MAPGSVAEVVSGSKTYWKRLGLLEVRKSRKEIAGLGVAFTSERQNKR